MQIHRLPSFLSRAVVFGPRKTSVRQTVLLCFLVSMSSGSMPAVFGQSAEEDTAPPKSQLLFGTIKIDGADQVEIDYSLFAVDKIEVTDTVNVPYRVTKVVDGREVVVTEPRAEIRTRVVEKINVRLIRRAEQLDRIKLFRVSGKALNASDINAIREQKTVAILLQNDESIDPYYQSILKPDTIAARLPALQRTQ